MTPKARICKGTISIVSLTRVFNKFKETYSDSNTETEKIAVCKLFELTLERFAKILRKILLYRGTRLSTSPREVFRAAYMDGIIEDPDCWFDMIAHRNRTVHIYNEELADALYKELPKIITVMGILLADLQRL